MEELHGICSKRSLGSKQVDRKAGNFGGSRTFFTVTPERRIKLIGGSPNQFKIIEYSEFEVNFHVIEIPSFTRNQYRMQHYKAELKQGKTFGEPLEDNKFKILVKGSEQIIVIKQATRTGAVKQVIKEFKNLDELYEWYDGDWLLIKRKK